MLKTYRLDGLAHLVNETYLGSTSRYRAFSFQPGDIVRNQLFEEDGIPFRAAPPTGLVLWCVDNSRGDAVGILWSGDPDA